MFVPARSGMAEVYALIPSGHAAALWEATTELAKDFQADNPELSLDQARADAFVDLALANVHVTTTVNLGVSVLPSTSTTLGENPNPGEDDSLPDAQLAGAGAGRDLTSAGNAEEWDQRRDVDNDPWYARHTNPATGDSAATSDGTSADGVDTHSADLIATGSLPPASFTSPETSQCSPLPSGAVISGVHLPKVGYVPPDVVAALVAQLGTTIGLAILDANTGTLLHTVREAYRPDAGMRHFITIRDGRCRMFGCQLRAQHWDLDHAVPHPKGQTTPTNLAGLCRRHHRAKQRRSWRYHLMPDGVAVWQTPTGVTRVTYPEHHLPPPPAPPPEPGPEPIDPPRTEADDPPF